jgi:hypothetical protein
MCNYAVIVGDGGSRRRSRSVFVFQIPDDEDYKRLWETARAMALEIGLRDEEASPNVDGDPVVWKLIDIETLDLLGEKLPAVCEVYSEPAPAPADNTWMPDTVFHPEESEPGHSGVMAYQSDESSAD